MTNAPAQPVQGVEAVADDLAKAADFVAKTAEAVHAAIGVAIRLCQIHASECIDENPERQKLRLAVFSALEMPTINSYQASVTARRLADRLASPAPAPEAPAGWQDAGTAPRDGQKVLACWAGRTNNMMIVWYEDWTWHAQIGGWQSVVMDEPPTHWMPLPKPPALATQADDTEGEA